MTKIISKTLRGMVGGVCAAALCVAMTAEVGFAQSGGQRTIVGERYVPTIWVDPDGCEHWVMDDGAEGYMSPHVSRQGIPVCREVNLCGVINTDQMFATDSARINSGGRQRLTEFFQKAGAVSYTIVGHTDSRASDEYNMGLSLRRANAVASVAKRTGASIADVRGYGERMPKASNNTAAGMAKNRRVEILCWR
ncbi:OmpA family protein [Roseovarius marisflavi]|uniref:OmpA family protein n=1 Tax=Roseovarius marisflavi TaxID=1054996 RepID=UPI003CCC297D